MPKLHVVHVSLGKNIMIGQLSQNCPVLVVCRHIGPTVEPLSNDHPHQRPSLLYDHISCDGQCFLFVRSLTNDHPSNATNDRVRWNFLPRGTTISRIPERMCNEYPIEGSTFYI